MNWWEYQNQKQRQQREAALYQQQMQQQLQRWTAQQQLALQKKDSGGIMGFIGGGVKDLFGAGGDLITGAVTQGLKGLEWYDENVTKNVWNNAIGRGIAEVTGQEFDDNWRYENLGGWARFGAGIAADPLTYLPGAALATKGLKTATMLNNATRGTAAYRAARGLDTVVGGANTLSNLPFELAMKGAKYGVGMPIAAGAKATGAAIGRTTIGNEFFRAVSRPTVQFEATRNLMRTRGYLGHVLTEANPDVPLANMSVDTLHSTLNQISEKVRNYRSVLKQGLDLPESARPNPAEEQVYRLLNGGTPTTKRLFEQFRRISTQSSFNRGIKATPEVLKQFDDIIARNLDGEISDTATLTQLMHTVGLDADVSEAILTGATKQSDNLKRWLGNRKLAPAQMLDDLDNQTRLMRKAGGAYTKLSPAELAIEYIAKRHYDNTFREYREGTQLTRELMGGIGEWAKWGDAAHKKYWQNGIDKYLVRPFTTMVLGFPAFPLGNLMEEASMSLIGGKRVSSPWKVGADEMLRFWQALPPEFELPSSLLEGLTPETAMDNLFVLQGSKGLNLPDKGLKGLVSGGMVMRASNKATANVRRAFFTDAFDRHAKNLLNDVLPTDSKLWEALTPEQRKLVEFHARMAAATGDIGYLARARTDLVGLETQKKNLNGILADAGFGPETRDFFEANAGPLLAGNENQLDTLILQGRDQYLREVTQNHQLSLATMTKTLSDLDGRLTDIEDVDDLLAALHQFEDTYETVAENFTNQARYGSVLGQYTGKEAEHAFNLQKHLELEDLQKQYLGVFDRVIPQVTERLEAHKLLTPEGKAAVKRLNQVNKELSKLFVQRDKALHAIERGAKFGTPENQAQRRAVHDQFRDPIDKLRQEKADIMRDTHAWLPTPKVSQTPENVAESGLGTNPPVAGSAMTAVGTPSEVPRPASATAPEAVAPVAPIPSSSKPVATVAMNFNYGREGLPGYTGNLIDAIEAGTRTSTTRWGTEAQRLRNLKPGDLIEVKGPGGKTLQVEVTSINRVGPNSGLDIREWARAEGWSPTSRWAKKAQNDPGIQVHFRLAGQAPLPSTTPKIPQDRAARTIERGNDQFLTELADAAISENPAQKRLLEYETKFDQELGKAAAEHPKVLVVIQVDDKFQRDNLDYIKNWVKGRKSALGGLSNVQFAVRPSAGGQWDNAVRGLLKKEGILAQSAEGTRIEMRFDENINKLAGRASRIFATDRRGRRLAAEASKDVAESAADAGVRIEQAIKSDPVRVRQAVPPTPDTTMMSVAPKNPLVPDLGTAKFSAPRGPAASAQEVAPDNMLEEMRGNRGSTYAGGEFASRLSDADLNDYVERLTGEVAEAFAPVLDDLATLSTDDVERVLSEVRKRYLDPKGTTLDPEDYFARSRAMDAMLRRPEVRSALRKGGTVADAPFTPRADTAKRKELLRPNEGNSAVFPDFTANLDQDNYVKPYEDRHDPYYRTERAEELRAKLNINEADPDAYTEGVLARDAAEVALEPVQLSAPSPAIQQLLGQLPEEAIQEIRDGVSSPEVLMRLGIPKKEATRLYQKLEEAVDFWDSGDAVRDQVAKVLGAPTSEKFFSSFDGMHTVNLPGGGHIRGWWGDDTSFVIETIDRGQGRDVVRNLRPFLAEADRRGITLVAKPIAFKESDATRNRASAALFRMYQGMGFKPDPEFGDLIRVPQQLTETAQSSEPNLLRAIVAAEDELSARATASQLDVPIEQARQLITEQNSIDDILNDPVRFKDKLQTWNSVWKKAKIQNIPVDELGTLYREAATRYDQFARAVLLARETPVMAKGTLANIDAIFQKTGESIQKAGAEQLAQKGKEAWDRAVRDYHRWFTNYDSGGSIHQLMRHIFPFWRYQLQRYPRLAKTALRHPGLVTGYHRFVTQSGDGQVQIPGTSIRFNPTGGMMFNSVRTLLQNGGYAFNPNGNLWQVADEVIGRAGFTPGPAIGVPQAVFSGTPGDQVPTTPDIALNTVRGFAPLLPGGVGEPAGNIAANIQDFLPSRWNRYNTDNELLAMGIHPFQASPEQEKEAQQRRARAQAFGESSGQLFAANSEAARQMREARARAAIEAGVPEDVAMKELRFRGNPLFARDKDGIPYLNSVQRRQITDAHPEWEGLAAASTSFDTPVKRSAEAERFKSFNERDAFNQKIEEELLPAYEAFVRGEIDGATFRELRDDAMTQQRAVREFLNQRYPRGTEQALANDTNNQARREDTLAEMYYGLQPEVGPTGEMDWDAVEYKRSQLLQMYNATQEEIRYITEEYPRKRWSSPLMNALEEEYGRASDLMGQYQDLPRYPGLSEQQEETALRGFELLDRIKQANPRLTTTQALAILARRDPSMARITRQALTIQNKSRRKNAPPTPRSSFWDANPLLEKYYGS